MVTVVLCLIVGSAQQYLPQVDPSSSVARSKSSVSLERWALRPLWPSFLVAVRSSRVMPSEWACMGLQPGTGPAVVSQHQTEPSCASSFQANKQLVNCAGASAQYSRFFPPDNDFTPLFRRRRRPPPPRHSLIHPIPNAGRQTSDVGRQTHEVGRRRTDGRTDGQLVI